jgi:type VI secretion system protein ImpH
VENRYSLGRGLRLGRCAAIGSKVFDRTAKFRVSLGPLKVNTYKSLLPNSSNSQLLTNIIYLYINEPLICELELVCYQRDLDPTRLGGASDEPKDGGGVGRTVVLGRYRREDDRVHRYRTTIT